MKNSSSIDDQVRNLILETLYKAARANPTNKFLERRKMVDALRISERDLDFNIFYLEEKCLIELISAPAKPWIRAKIKALGIDVIEKPADYKQDFPFINVHVQGSTYGDIVIANNNSTVNFKKQMLDDFREAYEMIQEKADVTSEQKTEIIERAKLLEEELRKTEIDAGKIQHSWKWLKRNADWLVPTLTQVIRDGIKIAFGV